MHAIILAHGVPRWWEQSGLNRTSQVFQTRVITVSTIFPKWWSGTGLNRRRPALQAGALPLSYLTIGVPTGNRTPTDCVSGNSALPIYTTGTFGPAKNPRQAKLAGVLEYTPSTSPKGDKAKKVKHIHFHYVTIIPHVLEMSSYFFNPSRFRLVILLRV